MEISCLGHASFKIKGKTATIVTDPFDEYVGYKFPKTKADIVTISHNHKDHNRKNLVSEVKKVIDGPGEYEVSGVSIIGFSTFHDEKKGRLRGKNTVYVFEIDGARVVHLGDLGHKLNEKQLEFLGDVDVLMIPIGGEYTIDSQTAAGAVRDIEPKIVIPMHYWVKGMNKDAFGKLAGIDSFISEVGLPTEKLEKLIVKKGLTEEEQRVVHLLPFC